jgi:hypothetical protein
MHGKLFITTALPCISTFAISHLEKACWQGSGLGFLRPLFTVCWQTPLIELPLGMHGKLFITTALPCISTFAISHLKKA